MCVRIFRSILVCPDILPCSRCKKEKPKSDFRIRIDKREMPEREYYNSTCMVCDSEVSLERYNKLKDDEDFKKKNNERTKAYANKNPEKIRAFRSTQGYKKKHNELEKKRYNSKREEINAKQKLKRQTDKYKKMMREYRLKNKEKIYQQDILTKKKYHEKNRDLITDIYCVRKLKEQNIQPTTENIELKRVQILIARLKKKISNNKKK